jgi:hypothetical protein
VCCGAAAEVWERIEGIEIKFEALELSYGDICPRHKLVVSKYEALY